MAVQKPNMKKSINVGLKTTQNPKPNNEYAERQKVLAAQSADRGSFDPNTLLHIPQPQQAQGFQMNQFQQNFQPSFSLAQTIDFTSTPNSLVNPEDLTIKEDLAELLSTMEHGQILHTLSEIYGIKCISPTLQYASNVRLLLGDAAKQSQSMVKGILTAVKENVVEAIGQLDEEATKNISDRIDAFFDAYVKVCKKLYARQEAQRTLMEGLSQQTYYEQHLYFRDIFQRQTQELYGRYTMSNEDVERAAGHHPQQQQPTQSQPEQADTDTE